MGMMCRRGVRHAHLKQLLNLGNGQLHSIWHWGPLRFVVCVHLMPARHAGSCLSLALLILYGDYTIQHQTRQRWVHMTDHVIKQQWA